MSQSQLHKVDLFLILLIFVTLAVTVAIYIWNTDYFYLSFAAEDRLVENGTALFLLVASFVLASNARSLCHKQRVRVALFTAFYALLFFAASGEEISWGQRIFGWESSEFVRTHNNQGETNLHNMIVFGKPLSKTLFGGGLTTVLLVYLVVFPVLYPRIAFIKRLADWFAVPVPGMRHAALAVIASLVIASIDVARKWEVYELVFSILAVSTFLLPQNRDKVV
ncbi:hypothetical protein PEL8287_01368 [Roseovarius litorisediminis]|uniref:Uncharacterized protein n=1 Tax=Roseovarius litorisediminis TaxID=1312363 RepID=A0A1Y5S194_9RHOB|nr:hypothetical protein [Roseovarius litorisediminis]SLN29785.1 hypothetical protein PEL8287_01368 [Roseovarius litorisediminis]